MNLGSCHTPAWVPSKTPPNSAWAAARRIRGQLCRLCDLALEAKDCGKLSRFRHHELKILRALHGDFERLDLNTVHGIPAAECDVCCLARATKRMALSVYAGEYTDFLHATRETPDGMTVRVSHDFGDDFRRYIARSELPKHSKTHQLMARAVMVSQYLAAVVQDPEMSHENTALVRIRIIDDTPPPLVRQSANALTEMGYRVAMLLGSHLRILPGSS